MQHAYFYPLGVTRRGRALLRSIPRVLRARRRSGGRPFPGHPVPPEVYRYSLLLSSGAPLGFSATCLLGRCPRGFEQQCGARDDVPIGTGPSGQPPFREAWRRSTAGRPLPWLPKKTWVCPPPLQLVAVDLRPIRGEDERVSSFGTGAAPRRCTCAYMPILGARHGRLVRAHVCVFIGALPAK